MQPGFLLPLPLARLLMERYVEIRKIGAGSFGVAHLARVVARPDEVVVIKRVDLSGMTEEERKAARREAAILAHLSHPAVIQHIERRVAAGEPGPLPAPAGARRVGAPARA